MINFILGPREHHMVRTPDEYQQAQAKFIAQRQEKGARYEIHQVDTPVNARVDHNTWVVDCECGAGNAVDPTWPAAYCFGCGAIHNNVVWPLNRERIEEILLQRVDVTKRNWRIGESEEDLTRENFELGVPVP